MFNRKGISPVVATALLIVVAVGALVGFQTWFSQYSSQVYTDTEKKSTVGASSIEKVSGKNLYFNHNSNNNLSISSVEIDGKDCSVNTSLTKGINKIPLDTNCINNISGKAEIVVHTNDKIYSEFFLGENKEFTSACGGNSQTYSSPNASQNLTVTSSMLGCSFSFIVDGADGGDNPGDSHDGGVGGRTTITFSPSETGTFEFVIGGAGGNGSSQTGAGGGGSSSVKYNPDSSPSFFIAVAGGGGGAGSGTLGGDASGGDGGGGYQGGNCGISGNGDTPGCGGVNGTGGSSANDNGDSCGSVCSGAGGVGEGGEVMAGFGFGSGTGGAGEQCSGAGGGGGGGGYGGGGGGDGGGCADDDASGAGGGGGYVLNNDSRVSSSGGTIGGSGSYSDGRIEITW